MFTILFLNSLLIIDCTSTEETIPECNLLPWFNSSERFENKTLKGHILFSWTEDFGWHYSIVPNLNSKPATDGVSINTTMVGEDCLRENIGLLAGEANINQNYTDCM